MRRRTPRAAAQDSWCATKFLKDARPRLYGSMPGAEAVPGRHSPDMHGLSEAQFNFEAVAIEQDDFHRFQGQIGGQQEDGAAVRGRTMTKRTNRCAGRHTRSMAR